MIGLLNCTESAYLADPCETPSLSQSIAHTLVARSPAHAWQEHPRLGGGGAAPTKAQDEGTILHQLILGAGHAIEILQFENYRTKAAQEARDAAIADDKVPVLDSRYTELAMAAGAIRRHLLAAGCDLEGTPELPIAFEQAGVQCRSKLDLVDFSRARIVDLKKITSADPATCSAHMYRYGYDIQWAAYTAALESVRPDLAGRTDFVFAFYEIEPPYAVFPARPDGLVRELGARRWERAVSLWMHCLTSGSWPGYATEIGSVTMPAWALSQEPFEGTL